MKNNYIVFKRAWWRVDKTTGQLVPYPGARKTILRRGLTIEEARQFCTEWNATNKPGKTSIKAEFTQE